MDYACRMRISNLNQVVYLLSETLLNNLAFILGDRTRTIVSSWNAGGMIAFLRSSGQKQAVTGKKYSLIIIARENPMMISHKP